MQDGELVRGVEVRAIFPDGMADRDPEFVVRALEAVVASVDPDGWVEVLHRCEGGFVKVAEDRSSEPVVSTNGNETGQGGGWERHAFRRGRGRSGCRRRRWKPGRER